MTVVRAHNKGETELVKKCHNAIDAVPFGHCILGTAGAAAELGLVRWRQRIQKNQIVRR